MMAGSCSSGLGRDGALGQSFVEIHEAQDRFLVEAVNAVPTVSSRVSLAYQGLPVDFHQLVWFDRDGPIHRRLSR